MPFECGLDDAALDALAASVDQPDFPEARVVRGENVFLDNRWNVARRERVQIDVVFGRDPVFFPHQASA